MAFLPGHIVPGIDFTNDPLLQGRLFSYRDTQLSRLGSPNFHQIPINRPIVETHNNQRDAHMQMAIPKGQTAYFPNTLGGGCPHLTKIADGAFDHYEEKIDAKKIRSRSKSFTDYYSQPALFYRSLSKSEQNHVADAYSFELGKCTHPHIQERMLYLIAQIDGPLSKEVADKLGLKVPKTVNKPINQAIGADVTDGRFEPAPKKNYLDQSPALSQANTKFDTVASRQIAVLAANGFSMKNFKAIKSVFGQDGAQLKIVAPHGGNIKCDENMEHPVDAAIMTTESVLFDAIYIPGGEKSIKALLKEGKYIKFINEGLKHCKAIAADGEAEQLLKETFVMDHKNDTAIFINGN